MIKTFYAVVVSAIAAGCFVAFPNVLEQVRATPAAVADSVASPAVVGQCGQKAWPYFDSTCLRNTGPTVGSRDVRFVTADRRGDAAER